MNKKEMMMMISMIIKWSHDKGKYLFFLINKDRKIYDLNYDLSFLLCNKILFS